MSDSITSRLHGDPDRHVLVYLPGLHGDFTLVRRFRERITERTAFVEFAYPIRGRPSLNDMSEAVYAELERLGAREVTLLAESFGSQVAWAMISQGRDTVRIHRLVLSGGFIRHPWPAGVHLARRLTGAMRRRRNLILETFPWYGRLAYESRPGLAEDLTRFVEARSRPEDREAIHHRLELIASSDFRPVAAETRIPVHHLTGVFDPIVPWPPVMRWLKLHCPGYQGTVRFHTSDHAVLVSRPTAAAQVISRWVGAEELTRR